MNIIKKYIKDFEDKTGARVVYVTKSGSKLYGTDTPTSDTDFKGIFIPSKESVLLKKDLDHYVRDTNNTKEKNTEFDIDFTLHSVYTWFNLLAKSETGAIDVLWSMFTDEDYGNIVFQDKEFVNLIKENKDVFQNSNMKSFIGYALGQTKKFGIKGARYGELRNFVNEIESRKWDSEERLLTVFPEIQEILDSTKFKHIKFIEAKGPKTSNTETMMTYISVLGKMFSGTITIGLFIERVKFLFEGFGNRTKTIANTVSKTDFKALSHSKRISEEVLELIETGSIRFPLKNAEEIKEIKSGNADINKVVQEIEDALNKVDVLLESSTLPKECNRDEIDKLLLRLI